MVMKPFAAMLGKSISNYVSKTVGEYTLFFIFVNVDNN